MNVSIVSKTKNIMMKRTEVQFEVHDASGTPKRMDVKAKLEAQLSASSGTVVVVRMNQPFGQNELTGIAYQYESKEALENVEHEHRLKKNGLVEEKKEAAPAA